MEPSNPENKNNQPEEHETHTTALVFLVIASLIIAYVALTYNGDISDTPGQDDQTPATTSQATSSMSDIAIGSVVPQSEVEATATNDLSSLPDGFYIEEGNITENQMLDTGNQIVRFTTDRKLSRLYDEYLAWTKGSQYEVVHDSSNGDTIKVVGAGEIGQITFSATQDEERVKVSISHVLFE